MASTAIETQGVYFEWDGSVVGEIVSFNGPGGSASVIDVTHLGSTRREKRMGIADEGQISFELNLVPGDAGQGKLRLDRSERNLKSGRLFLTDDSGTILTFDAYCMQFSIQGSVDNKVQASVTLEITGVVNWSPRLVVETAWDSGSQVIKLEVEEDTFAAGVTTTGNWTITGWTDIAISSVTETGGVATVTVSGGTPTAGSTQDITIQAKAAALTGVYPSGVLRQSVLIAE